MNRITSTKLLKGLPCLAAGGLDCKPTLATISGCVAMVANALDVAPKTDSGISGNVFSGIRRIDNAEC